MQSPYQAQPQAAALPYVGVGLRFVAVLIDGIIFGIISSILLRVLGLTGTYVSDVLLIAYYIWMEGQYGATLGKMALGLKVVKEDGSPITWQESIIRNLVRIVDMLLVFYLVSAILVWTSPLKQRIGDRVAHTVVIKAR